MSTKLDRSPKCNALGCCEYADPRFYIHGPDGKGATACDGHGNPGCSGAPCTCPPPKPKDEIERWSR